MRIEAISLLRALGFGWHADAIRDAETPPVERVAVKSALDAIGGAQRMLGRLAPHLAVGLIDREVKLLDDVETVLLRRLAELSEGAGS
jgi:hypothetical protein